MNKVSRIFTLLVLIVPLLAAPAFAAKKKASIKVINQSKWEIHHLFLSSVKDNAWGPDQLGEEILKKGDAITLKDIECDKYDIKVIDEDGDECVVEDQSLCGDDSYWKITDAVLLACENESN